MKRLIVGITGASGSCYAVRLIDVLRDLGMEVHAVLTASGRQVLDYECGVTEEDLARRVTVVARGRASPRSWPLYPACTCSALPQGH